MAPGNDLLDHSACLRRDQGIAHALPLGAAAVIDPADGAPVLSHHADGREARPDDSARPVADAQEQAVQVAFDGELQP